MLENRVAEFLHTVIVVFWVGSNFLSRNIKYLKQRTNRQILR